jgi:hypothetical protein
MADEKEGSSRIKTIGLICTTIVAIGSLALNIVQYRYATARDEFELVKSYPSVEVFRLTLNGRDVHLVRRLAAKGAKFSQIPNPAFVDDGTLAALPADRATKIDFVVCANRSTTALSDVVITQGDGKTLQVTHVAPESTLLIAEAIRKGSEEPRQFGQPARLAYKFNLGGHRLDAQREIPVRGADTIVFEAGLGPITKGSYDFDLEQ